MSDTTYVDLVGPQIMSSWLNDVNITIYRALGVGGVAPTTPAQIISNLAIPTLAANNTFTGANIFSGALTFSGASIPFTNTPTFPTAAPGDNSTKGATTAFIAASYAPLASPALTGTPTVPTAALNTNNTQAASTAFVGNAIANSTDVLFSVSASVATNALTVGFNPGIVYFRSATLTSGVPTSVNINAALSLTVPSGATLGTVNGISARLVLILAYNGGTPVLCITNTAGALNLDETTLISPTTISGTSNSSNVIYSSSAVGANSPFRVVGFLDITEATAGTWASAPTLVHGSGGEVIATLGGVGQGQTYQNMTASRAISSSYYNTTGKAIKVSFWGNNNTQNGYIQATVGAGVVAVSTGASVAGGIIGIYFEVPSGSSYSITPGNGTMTTFTWFEER